MNIRTMVRHEVTVNETRFTLAQGQDIAALKTSIEFAVRHAGRFVDFVVVGNRRASILVTPFTRIVIASTTVLFDARDTGDEGFPFGGFFDA